MGADPTVAGRNRQRGAFADRDFALIRYVASTGSTNADLLAAVAAGAGVEGEWLVAHRQSAGRGRQGRHWDSPEGNFHGSTLVRLRTSDPSAATLSLVAGVALHRTVAEVVPDHTTLQLKWPNDLLVGPAKLGGILLERAGDAVVCGIGVNLGWAPDVPGRETVSLANLGLVVAVNRFAPILAATFADTLLRWRSQPLANLRADWLSRAHALGTPLTRLDAGGRQLTGRFDGLEEDGSLRLSSADGAVQIISSGEVMLG